MRRILSILLCMFLTSWGVLAQTIVAPNGNDNTGDGTVGSPYASIRKAIEAVPAGGTILVQDDNSGSTITYVETDPLQINKAMTISGLGENVRVTPSRNATNLFVISASNVTIEGLIIDGTNGNLKANNLIALSPFNQSLDNVVIRQNSLINAGSNNPNVVANGILISAGTGGSGASNLTISNNFINNNGVGVQVNASVSGQVFENNLENNSSFAIQNTSTQAVNTSLNWWGSEVPALLTNEINDITRVDYSPWLAEDTDDLNVEGFQSDFADLAVRKTNLSMTALTEAYDILQAGGTIFVHSPVSGVGAQYEALVATKDASLISLATGTLRVNSLTTTNDAQLTLVGQFRATTLSLQSGQLIVGGAALVLEDTNLNINNQAGTFTGAIVNAPATVLANESFSFLGAQISSGNQQLTGVTISRLNNVEVNFGNSRSIDVIWDIEVNESLDNDPRTLTLTWDRSLDGVNSFGDDSKAFVWKSEDDGQNWQFYSLEDADVPGIDTRVVRVNGVTSFSQWTVSDENNPLPVELTAFSASLLEPHVQLNWETASEINSDFFAIERSENALDFRQVGSLKAAGDSDAPLQYSFIDEQAARRFSGTLFYRLRIVDFDGSYEYSDITSIAVTDEGAPMISAFAREGQQSIKIFTRSVEAGDYQLQISDLSGRKLFDQQVQLGNNQEHQLNIGNLPQSVYMIRCVGKQIVLASKFKVE